MRYKDRIAASDAVAGPSADVLISLKRGGNDVASFCRSRYRNRCARQRDTTCAQSGADQNRRDVSAYRADFRARRSRAVRAQPIQTSLYTMMMEGFSPYGPSKAALESATVIWSKDLVGTGVTVNALAPVGPADTRMIPKTEIDDRSKLIPLDLMMAPIVWLMSRQSDGINGRRIIAKEWDAERLHSEPIGNIGIPAGW